MSAHRTKRPVPLGKRVATYRSLPPTPLTLGAWFGVSLWVVLQTGYLIWGVRSLWSATVLMLPMAVGVAWVLRVPRRVDLYQNGLDYRVGRRHRYLFWNQIYEVYQTPLYALHRSCDAPQFPDAWMYRLVRRDGSTLRLYRLESIRTLGQRIQDQVTRRHLPLALDAFHAGYSIRFGRHLAVSLDGLRIGRHRLTWHGIAEISIDETRELRVTLRDQPDTSYQLAIRRVPNLALLDGILRASQGTSEIDPLDIAPQRSILFEDVELDDAAQETGGSTQLLHGHEGPDDGDDVGPSHRPRHPK